MATARSLTSSATISLARPTPAAPCRSVRVKEVRRSSCTHVAAGKRAGGHQRGAARALAAAAAAAGSGAAGPVGAEGMIIDVDAVVKTEKVLVLGGSGFVGSAVAERAIGRGFDVVSLSRSGRPDISDAWASSVDWEQGDVFAANWGQLLDGVDVVVSCIGGFGTDDQMQRINGDANIVAVDAAKDLGVRKFVYISVHDYNLPDFMKNNGYFNGKQRAEIAVLSAFPSAVILRPGFIYGRRRVNGTEVPLDLIGQPLDKLLAATKGITKLFASLPGSDLVLAPPVDVAEVAAVAVRAVVDDSVVGVLTIDDIKRLAADAP